MVKLVNMNIEKQTTVVCACVCGDMVMLVLTKFLHQWMHFLSTVIGRGEDKRRNGTKWKFEPNLWTINRHLFLSQTQTQTTLEFSPKRWALSLRKSPFLFLFCFQK